jgi:hypothetical protein
MSNKFNNEGYYDPTAYEALNHIEQETKKATYRPLVFICSPYSGDIEGNTKKAARYCRFAYSKNVVPFAPHLHNPNFLDENIADERSAGIKLGLELLSKADELWCFGKDSTEGMLIELAYAIKNKIPIRYFNERCEVIVNNNERKLK